MKSSVVGVARVNFLERCALFGVCSGGSAWAAGTTVRSSRCCSWQQLSKAEGALRHPSSSSGGVRCRGEPQSVEKKARSLSESLRERQQGSRCLRALQHEGDETGGTTAESSAHETAFVRGGSRSLVVVQTVDDLRPTSQYFHLSAANLLWPSNLNDDASQIIHLRRSSSINRHRQSMPEEAEVAGRRIVFLSKHFLSSNANKAVQKLRCWNCGKPEEPTSLLCVSCGKISEPKYGYTSQEDHFKLIGIKPTFEIDREALDRKYARLQQIVHPDKLSERCPREREYAAEHSQKLSAATNALRQPLHRAKHLMQVVYGRECLAEGERVKDPELLKEVVEVYEQLEDEDDAEEVAKLKRKYEQIVENHSRTLSELFAREDIAAIEAVLPKLQLHSKIYERILEWESETQASDSTPNSSSQSSAF